jgi:multiple sugar transport system permease protein
MGEEIVARPGTIVLRRLGKEPPMPALQKTVDDNANTSEPEPAARRKQSREAALSRSARRLRRYGIIFVAPWIIGFVIFMLGPALTSLYYSFTNYNPVKSDTRFIGLDNWRRLFTDPEIGQALEVSLRSLLILVPLSQIYALALALLFSSKRLRFRRLALTVLCLPVMVPTMATAAMWQGLFDPRDGWVPEFLAFFGVTIPEWLMESVLALMGMWGIGLFVIILMLGLQRVPPELYEAAQIDGANRRRTFWHITLPIMSPVIFFNLVMSVIGSLQSSGLFAIYRDNFRPNGDSFSLTSKFYKEGWSFYDHGYASAIAWFFLLLVLAVMALIVLVSRRFVYYEYQKPGS